MSSKIQEFNLKPGIFSSIKDIAKNLLPQICQKKLSQNFGSWDKVIPVKIYKKFGFAHLTYVRFVIIYHRHMTIITGFFNTCDLIGSIGDWTIPCFSKWMCLSYLMLLCFLSGHSAEFGSFDSQDHSKQIIISSCFIYL